MLYLIIKLAGGNGRCAAPHHPPPPQRRKPVTKSQRQKKRRLEVEALMLTQSVTRRGRKAKAHHAYLELDSDSVAQSTEVTSSTSLPTPATDWVSDEIFDSEEEHVSSTHRLRNRCRILSGSDDGEVGEAGEVVAHGNSSPQLNTGPDELSTSDYMASAEESATTDLDIPGDIGEEYLNQVCGSLLKFKKSS